MSGDPTLVMRVDRGNALHLGNSCHIVAAAIAGRAGFKALDATWSHPADKFTAGEWPRRRLTAQERAMVEAVDALVGADVAAPAALVQELVAIIRRVAHA